MTKSKVTLACTVCHDKNYRLPKSKGNAERLIIKKFCPKCNAHTEHREEK